MSHVLTYKGHGVTLHKQQKLTHHSGREYRIVDFANVTVKETEEFPHMVIYRNIANGTTWTRPIRDILGKFKLERSH